MSFHHPSEKKGKIGGNILSLQKIGGSGTLAKSTTTSSMEDDVGPCLLDSSVWIGLFLDDDTNHDNSAAVFDSLPRIVYVPYVVIAEVATVLAHKHSKQQADNFLRYISDDERFSKIDNRYSKDIPAFLNQRERISFTDVAIIGAALAYEATLITFDKQMKKLYAKLSLRPRG